MVRSLVVVATVAGACGVARDVLLTPCRVRVRAALVRRNAARAASRAQDLGGGGHALALVHIEEAGGQVGETAQTVLLY